MKKMVNDLIFTKIKEMNTKLLLSIFLILGFIFILWANSYGLYKGNANQEILISIAFFFWGCMGIPIIIRKDYPLIRGIKLKGIWAVIQGLTLIVCCWALALVSLIPIIRSFH